MGHSQFVAPRTAPRLRPATRLSAWPTLRTLIMLGAISGMAGLVEAQATRPVRSYTDEDLRHDTRSSAKRTPASAGEANHFVTAKLYFHYPLGTDLNECRSRYQRDQQRQIGDRSGHCDCPNLEPHGIVVSVELLGGDDRQEIGDYVSFGMNVRMGCACPAISPAADTDSQHDYERFRRELKRLKKGCVQGQREYCAPFEAYLQRFQEFCDSRFADQTSCRGYVDELRGASPHQPTKLADSPVEHTVTYNMPCSRERLATCEDCIRWQTELNSFVESVGKKRCLESGFPTLVDYRNVSCTATKHGPNPIYEAHCGR